MTETPKEGEEDTSQHELVIIRRRNDGDEAPHKGGVWKIAHADFMTALMAFFLVMWLINATDDKTVTGIANYFNPMRLSEATTKPKGVFTMEGGSEQDGKQQGSAPKPSEHRGKNASPDKTPPKDSEAALFSDPYEALDQIAAQAAKEAPARAITEKGNVPAHHTGEEFRDPFDPEFQQGQFQPGKVGGESGKKDEGAAATAKSDGNKSEPSSSKVAAAHEGSDNEKKELSPAKSDKRPESDRDREGKRANLKREIQEAVARAGFPVIPGIDVQATSDGLLISITDQYNFEMFGIASARPKPELVVLMEKIGGVIAKRPEHLVIRGHTDGRPFKSQDYDNWRLSAARAHMANYMLVRSGVAEARVDRIEGHADHDLRVRDDPLAAPNRRIEILLQESKP